VPAAVGKLTAPQSPFPRENDCWIPADNTIGREVADDNASCSHNRAFPDFSPLQYNGTRSNKNVSLQYNGGRADIGNAGNTLGGVQRMSVVVHDKRTGTYAYAVADLYGLETLKGAATHTDVIANQKPRIRPACCHYDRLNYSDRVGARLSPCGKIVSNPYQASLAPIDDGEPEKAAARPAFHTNMLKPPWLNWKNEPLV
jgi:hypothetical protein